MIRPTIRQLTYLAAIADEGSFVAAAEKCLVTQSTLSAGIKELENILGQKLIVRGRKQTELTAFGYEVLEQARAVLELTDTIMARSKTLSEPLTGPLRLGIIPTIAPYLLPDFLPDIQHSYPRLELQIHEDMTERLLESLRRRQIDLALMAFPYDTPGMAQLILFEEPFYAALPENAALDETSIALKDLEPEKLLLLEDGHCLREHALSACKIQLPHQRKTFSASSLPTLIQMVRAGFGITLLPAMAARLDAVPPGISLLPFKEKTPPTRQIGLCWRQNDPKAHEYEKLGKIIRQLAT